MPRGSFVASQEGFPFKYCFGSIHFLFFATLSLGTASGEFPRPAASRRLLFRLLPRNLLKLRRRFLVPLPKSRRSPWEWSPLAD